MLLLIMKVVFSFLLKLNSHHPHTFTSALQQTLKQNHGASHNCNSVKTMLKLSAFKKLLNELLLETEWSEAMLMWWFVSIKFIRSFLIYFFFNIFIKAILCNFNLTGRTVPFPSTDITFSSVLLRKVSSSFSIKL